MLIYQRVTSWKWLFLSKRYTLSRVLIMKTSDHENFDWWGFFSNCQSEGLSGKLSGFKLEDLSCDFSRDLSDQTWGFKLTNSRYRLNLTNLILLKHWNLTHKPATKSRDAFTVCVFITRRSELRAPGAAEQQRWKCLEHCCAPSLFGWTWPCDLLRPWAASLRWLELSQKLKSYRNNGLK